ncbi:MAG: ABC transporter ATP-binding protein [Candidatus Anammoxibacter sp.]
MSSNVIEVKDLKTHFSSSSGLIKAVDGISFNVPEGKTFAIVGESGSGKSVTALSIMRLIPKSKDVITTGEVMLGDVDLLKISEREMTGIRGKEIGMVFQEPTTSLNPVMKIGDQVKEVVMIHNGLKKRRAKEEAVHMLGKLGIKSPETIIDKYPHQMSGGMKQRIMIAMALICTPKLLIADEPTTSLDVTIQAVIIDIIKKLQTTLKMSIIFITHDLGVVAEVADYVAVMKNGKIVENTDVKTFFRNPQHPYSVKLLNNISILTSD